MLGVDGKWHTGNKETIWRWRTAYQNDFEARMNWSITPYAGANHPPVAKLKNAGRTTAKPSERVQLSAEGSSDPDGNALSYQWIYYPEARHIRPVQRSQRLAAQDRKRRPDERLVTVPAKFRQAGTIHIILAVTDNGTPALTRYRRVIK